MTEAGAPARLIAGAELHFPERAEQIMVPSADGRLPKAGDPVMHPLLLCEVLSPSSSRHDRVTKRRAFQRHEVPTYWVVDGDAEVFEIWHPGDTRALTVGDRLKASSHDAAAP